MAVNQVNTSDGDTLMDITDTTATASDVASGEVFYAANGERSVGTMESGGASAPSTAVLYTEQTLADEQKTQARTNIGACKVTLKVWGDDD